MEVQLEKTSAFSSDLESPRAKSPHRMHYEAQVEVIRKQLGDLEKIRENLGLSQRKISQLLMVDPSAWTRWTKKGESAPPHIYRALQWYMILQEKLPGLTPQYFVGKDPEVLHQAALQRIQIEAQKREEFEEAFSFQTLSMERQLQELLKTNRELSKSKSELERQVSTLKKDISFNRLGLILLSAASVVLVGMIVWKFSQ